MLTRQRHVPVAATRALTPVDSLPLCCGSSHRAETEGVVSAVLSGAESTDPAYGKPYRRVACTNLCRPRCKCATVAVRGIQRSGKCLGAPTWPCIASLRAQRSALRSSPPPFVICLSYGGFCGPSIDRCVLKQKFTFLHAENIAFSVARCSVTSLARI